MSHELRTALNAVIGFSDIIRNIRNELMGPVGGAKYREYANDIYSSGAHLLQVINDILDVAKIEAGKTELHEDILDFGHCADSALRLMEERAAAAGLRLERELPSDLPPLYADQRKVKQILINLLSNSIKFTPPGRRRGRPNAGRCAAGYGTRHRDRHRQGRYSEGAIGLRAGRQPFGSQVSGRGPRPAAGAGSGTAPSGVLHPFEQAR